MSQRETEEGVEASGVTAVEADAARMDPVEVGAIESGPAGMDDAEASHACESERATSHPTQAGPMQVLATSALAPGDPMAAGDLMAPGNPMASSTPMAPDNPRVSGDAIAPGALPLRTPAGLPIASARKTVPGLPGLPRPSGLLSSAIAPPAAYLPVAHTLAASPITLACDGQGALRPDGALLCARRTAMACAASPAAHLDLALYLADDGAVILHVHLGPDHTGEASRRHAVARLDTPADLGATLACLDFGQTASTAAPDLRTALKTLATAALGAGSLPPATPE
ncbi:MAG: hypothetical protein AAGI34_11225 [Pseudomonadota bacterium]